MKGAKCLSILMVIAFIALVAQIFLPVPVLADDHNHGFKHFNVDGRYVSAENAYDVSSVHAFSGADSSLVGPPVFFATAEIMILDKKGNVCGAADGFYSGISAPGVNLGPVLFHGKYTIDPIGRIIITTCSDGQYDPNNPKQFCATFGACPDPLATSVQVGYVQGPDGKKIVTVNQTGFGTDSDSTGFLVHKREWTKSESSD